MLKTLAIQNFAIIEKLDLEFDHGLCIITGETGAGKSILIEALGIAIGQRIRPYSQRDKKKLSVTLDFDVSKNSTAKAWLDEHNLHSNDDCLLRRTISPDGRSRAYINGFPATVTQLKELGGILTDIVGQNTHQFLMQSSRHLEILDLQCSHTTALKKLHDSWQQWKHSCEKIALRRQKTETMQSRIELLRYQVQELETFAPAAGEFELIEQEHKRLSAIDTLVETAHEVRQVLDGTDDKDIYTSLARITTQLETFTEFDKNLAAAKVALEAALESIQSANDELGHSIEKTHFSEEEFNQLETRLSHYIEFARKHQVPAREIADLYQRLSSELDDLSNPQHSLEELEKECAEYAKLYQDIAQSISKKRHDTAAGLNTEVTQLLHKLNMPQAEFNIYITPQQQEFHPRGMDHVEFMIKTNAGSPSAPLAQISSGGELSRISLALQVALAKHHPVSTLVFDEVDAGVGGKTAAMTGEMLQQLSDHVQVFCITHLAQIAAFANRHYFVDKHDDRHQTSVTVSSLDNKARCPEIARMLAGSQISKSALENAQEMLNSAQQSAPSSTSKC